METRREHFSISPLFFWVKGNVEVDYRFIKTNIKNTILGFIPAGSDNQNIPLKNVSAAMLNTGYNIKSMFLGFIVVAVGFALMDSNVLFGFLIMIYGVGMFLSGIKTTLVIQRAGSDYIIEAPFYEKTTMLRIQDMIQDALALDADKTDNFILRQGMQQDGMMQTQMMLQGMQQIMNGNNVGNATPQIPQRTVPSIPSVPSQKEAEPVVAPTPAQGVRKAPPIPKKN